MLCKKYIQSQIMTFSFWDVILLVIFILALYYYVKVKHEIYINTDIKHIRPPVPFLGNIFKVKLLKQNIIDFFQEIYAAYPNEKYVGLYYFTKPLILLQDVQLVKKLLIKEFDSFSSHKVIMTENLDALFGKSLVTLDGQKWRDMRSTLSPAFTSAKMKNMFVFIEHNAKQVADYFLNKESKSGIIHIEAKDVLTRYTNDVIANSAFGLEINSLKDVNNEFYQNTKLSTNFGGSQLLKMIGYEIFPKLMKFLGIEFVDKTSKSFFQNLVKDTMEFRKKNSIKRNDMIHLLMEAKRGKLEYDNTESSEAGFATAQEFDLGKHTVKTNWSEDDIVAQAFIFLFGGFDTIATFLTFFFYEMVKNQDVQKKLQKEIDEFISNNNNKLDYSDLQKLTYLDCCVSEALRMWPPGIFTDRICKKSFTLPPPNENSNKSYQIEVGNSIWIPIYSFHHDPKYFPNPEKFDPDRFSEENKSKINIDAYMPFGCGPRNCIASRYALMVGKIIIFHMLAKFDVVKTDKTVIPIILGNTLFNILAKGGVHIGLKSRL